MKNPIRYSYLYFILCLLTLSSWSNAQISLSSQEAKELLAPIKALEAKQRAKIGIEITNCSSGDLLLAHGSDRSYIPASLAKLFTTATALRLMGPEYRYRTEVVSEGEIKNGVLKGNLIIKGSGDPSIASNYILSDSARFMQSLSEMLFYYGIKKIEGDIVVDASAFEARGVEESWLDEDKGNYYGAGVYGFNINDNRIDLILRSRKAGSKSEIRAIYPPHPEVNWENKILSARRGDTARSFGKGTAQHRLLTGIIPANRSTYRLRTDLPNPMLYTANLLAESFVKSGVELAGTARFSYEPLAKSKRDLLSYESMTLDTLIRICNFRSLNHFAEAFLKSIAAYSPVAPHHGLSSQLGAQVLHEYWRNQAGIFKGELSLVDGSGLSRLSSLTPSALTRLLVAMQTTKDGKGEIFLNSLPRAGEEGTVKSLLRNSHLELYVKSGSMKGVQGYAGYLRHKGELYSIVLIGNDLKNKTALRVAFEKLIATVFNS